MAVGLDSIGGVASGGSALTVIENEGVTSPERAMRLHDAGKVIAASTTEFSTHS
jgi:hypothetical protein